MLTPTRGRVQIDGAPLAELGPRERRAACARTGFVHQDGALVPNLRVLANVISGRFGHWSALGALWRTAWPARATVVEVYELLRQLGIEDKLYARLDTLSGGEQQRVALARALYQEPTLLLADEPVAAVDPERARALIDLLQSVCAQRGLTLVVNLHDLELARRSFTRLIGLRQGRVQFDAPTSDLTDADFAQLYDLGP